MALTKTFSIDGQDVAFRASAATPRIYRLKFGRDVYLLCDGNGSQEGNREVPKERGRDQTAEDASWPHGRAGMDKVLPARKLLERNTKREQELKKRYLEMNAVQQAFRSSVPST